MKMILPLVLAAACLLLIFGAAPARAETSPRISIPIQNQQISPGMLEALKSAPAATGRTAFELAAAQFNQWVDQQYAQTPKAQRPYLTPLRAAQLADSLVKSYRSGNRALAEEIAVRVPIEMSIDEKINFLELITQAYLAAEAKKW